MELASLLSAAARDAFADDLRGFMIKGSLVEHGGRDFIPYFSDVDCGLYLASSAMRGPVTPRVELAMRLRASLGEIDARSYGAGSWSFAFWDEARLEEWALQPLAGSGYRVMTGKLPATFREGTPEAYVKTSAGILSTLAETADRAARWSADLPNDRLAEQVRTVATWVKSALRSAVTVASGDAAAGWLAPLADVVRFVETGIVRAGAASGFYAELREWRVVCSEPGRLGALVVAAVTILDEIRAYFGAGERIG